MSGSPMAGCWPRADDGPVPDGRIPDFDARGKYSVTLQRAAVIHCQPPWLHSSPQPRHPMKRILILLAAGFYTAAWALSWLNAGPGHDPATRPGVENGAEINREAEAPGSLETWEPGIVSSSRSADSKPWG